MPQPDQHATTILITGATGFVGPYLLKALQAHPQFSHASIHAWEYRPGIASHADPVHVDICNAESVAASISALRPTHVIHLAAQSHVPTSFDRPAFTWQVNVMGTLNLLEAIKNHAPAAAVLYISSSEIYGNSFKVGTPLNETALLQPQNPYAASKAAADLMLRQYAAQGLRTLCLRPFNHIGPGQSEHFVASAFASQIARIESGLQEPVLLVGNLEARRDFLDVRDVVQAYLLALEQMENLEPGQVFNICSGTTTTISQLLQGLLKHTDHDINLAVDPARMRPSDIPVAAGDASAASASLGWYPRIPFDQTLSEILSYWRARTA